MKNRKKNYFNKKIIIVLAVLFCIFSGTSKSVSAKTKNSNDVKALQKIITVQRNKGAKVSTNLDNKEQYKWNKKTGRLQGINWNKEKLKGKVNFNKINGLKNIDISNNKITKICVEKLTKLETLECSKNKLKEINVKKNKALLVLDCSHNKLEK